MSPKFTCRVEIKIDGNTIEANDKTEYIKKVREMYGKQLGIYLRDQEIQNITRVINPNEEALM
tara:strand:- start:510 stop:698 length:189 start_codon:yes stop_codon:yes gene_type:complete